MALRLFIAGLIGLIIFIGCGGGGGGGGSGSSLSPVGPSLITSRILGTIHIDASVTSQRPSGQLASALFLSSLIFIEEMPNFSTRADNSGNFYFENVPAGTYHLIARVTSLAGREYKYRSPAISISSDPTEKRQDIFLSGNDLANTQVRLLVKDLQGVPVGRCRIWLWGEEFTMDPSGYYISPAMPRGTVGTIKIIPPSDKELSQAEFVVDSSVFSEENLSIIGLTVPTYGITNQAPQVSIAVGKYPGGNNAFLRLLGRARDPENEPLDIDWQTTISTFSYKTDDYADWAIPSENASATIHYVARENGFLYPRLTSSARLDISVASGVVSFPEGIVVEPVTRIVEINSSATSQIAGNVIARFEATTDFPAGVDLNYSWQVDSGTIVSGEDQREMFWRSPQLGIGEARIASISVTVEDGIGRAFNSLQLRVTSSPLAVIERPLLSTFEPGLIEFSGRARDYLNSTIPATSLSWFVATGTADFALQKAGAASFSYNFTLQGTYTVALSCVDSEGALGTGTKEIIIINARPVCVITNPPDNASFLANSPVNLVGVVNDYEEGLITDAARIGWSSDIDGFLGSGTSLTMPMLTSGRHRIRLTGVDSTGVVGSSSITIWYDLPARITFSPGDGDAVFNGHPIAFIASGTDSDGTELDTAQFKWYLNGLPEIWQTGAAFDIASGAMAPGTYLVRVEGISKLGQAVSPTQAIEIGWPKPQIISPASGTRFEPGSTVNFVGTPDSTGTLALEWYFNDDTVSFASGQNASNIPANGYYKVTYSGTDSQGNSASAAIGLIIERLPIISFDPDDAAYIFAGYQVVFDAVCVDTNNNTIPDAQVRWYRDGNFWRTGNTFVANQGLLPDQLSPGTHQIAVEATGPYTSVATVTHTIYSGIPEANITAPGNDSTFLTGTTVDFTAVPDSTGPIIMRWYANYGTPGQILLGEGDSVSTNSLADGYYEISYFGTDSVGRTSSDTINISIGQFPVMDFTPGDNTAFFANNNVVFYGVGTDTLTNLSIPANRMTWYIDSTKILASFSVFTVDQAMVDTVGAGLRNVELTGVSDIGAIGREVKSIYLGVANASITWPLTNTIIPTSTNYNFTGLPDNTGPLTMEWWLDYETATPVLLGNGASLNAVIPDGNHYITYIGTDSAGIVSSATIRVIISDSPSISFTPPNGSRLFVGQPFNLTVAGDVEEATAKWYRDAEATPFKTGSPALVSPGDLTVGSHQIKVVAENALGVSNEITNLVYYGVDLAQINDPASGSTFAIGATVDFAAIPAGAPPITMEWYRNDGTGAVFMSNAPSFSTAAIPPGLQTITYVGTDSAGYCSSDTIQILVNNSPAITFTPPADGVSPAIIFADQPFTLTGSGIEAIAPNPPIDPATFLWYLDGSPWKSISPATVNAGELSVGWHTIAATGVDQYGTVGTGTHNIFYGHTLASVVSPASGSVFALGSTVNLTGSNASPTISMRWLLNGAETGVTGQNYSPAPPAGWNTITYLGTDDAGNVSSSNTMILMDDPPAMDFTPGNGSRFFAGSSPVFTGVGTGSIAAYSVAASSMKWYMNGAAIPKTPSPVTFNPADMVVGNNSLKLTGLDQFGVEGEITYNFDYGHTLASITAPASGSSYNLGANVNFAGVPNTTAPITMYWYLDYGEAGETLLGNGANLTHSFATRGVKTITYLGTDSAGLLSSSKIQVLINDVPTMTIASPVNGGYYFGNQILSVSGSGVDIDANPIAPGTFAWYRDGSPWKTAVANFSATVVELGTGTLNVRLDGVDAYGTTGTITNTFTTGVTHPTIDNPASGSVYPLLSNVVLSGSPDLTGMIPTEWYWQNGTAVFGNGPNASIASLPRGLHTLIYRGTDDAGTTKSGTIQVILNNDPTLNVTAPISGGKYFGAQSISFSGNGTDSGGFALDPAKFKWFRDGTNFKNGLANFSATVAELPTGTLQIGLQGQDTLGAIGGATFTIDVGINHPQITSPASGAYYPEGSNVVLTGWPDLTGVINTEWYWQNGTTVFGNGPNASIATLPRGLHTLVYRGTDDAGTTKSGTIQVILNNDPTLNITAPISGGKYFGAQSISFSGNGTDSGGFALDPAKFKWFRDGTLFKSSLANFSATVAELPTGTLQIGLQGQDALGAIGGATFTIDVGINHPQITSPASGTYYPEGSNIVLTGWPDLTGVINTEWYWQNGTTVFGNGPNASIATLPRGLHTLVYRGTDDAGTTKSASIQVILNDEPTVNLASPVNGDNYFGNQTLFFSANGTDSGGTPLDAATYKWFRDGTLFKSGLSSFNASVVELPSGTRQISVQAADGFGTVGGATCTIEVGITHPSVTSPASGSYYPLASNVVLTGSPDLTGVINTEWYWPGGPAVFGNGPNASIASLPRGLHTLIYRGTDDAGTTKSGSIQVILNDDPTVNLLTPAEGENFFGNQNILLSANGTDSGGTPLDASAYKWYRDGTLFKTGFSSFNATVAELPSGTRQISVLAVDNFGAVDGATCTIEVGINHPTVTSPASGSYYALGTNLNLTGSPDLSGLIDTEWYWVEDTAIIGSGPTASIASLSRGLNTLVYRGTDDAGTTKSGSIQVVFNNNPTANITAPLNNAKFFGGQTLNFTGNATNSGGTPIAAANFKWFRDATNFKNGVDNFTATIAELPTGTRDISLVVFDEFNAVGNAATATVEFGISLPQITSPASGARFDISQNINFVGTPDSTGPITMEWYIDYGEVGEALLGNGASINTSFPGRGVKTITYVGTDSAGTTRLKTIQILVNDRPTYTITAPVNNGKYFGGQNINFAGSGLDSGGGPIDVASLRWYRNGSLWKSGVANFAGTVAELPTGTHDISLGGFDDLGTFNSATYSIQVGLGLPSITSPASGTRFDTLSNIAFTGSPDLTGLISMDWYWKEGDSVLANGPSLNTAALPRGYNTITYVGTDSQNTGRSATTMVLVDKLPTFISLPFISSPGKFANGPEYPLPGNYIPIHLASSGQQVTFSVTAQEEDSDIIGPTQIKWYEAGVFKENDATYTRNIDPGSYTFTVSVADEYNQVASANLNVWIWDSETYNNFPGGPAGINTLTGPTSILPLSTSEAFVIDPGHNRIVKLTRLTAGLSTIGDLTAIATETLAASQTHPFTDIAYVGTTLYSLGTQAGVQYRIQSWATNNLQSQTRDYLIPHGAGANQFNAPFAFCVDSNAIYVSDTGNNKLQKLDITNGSFYSESQPVLAPYDISLIDASTLAVGENANNKMLRFGNDLNNVASWLSQNVNNPTNHAYSASGNLYITDPAGAKVHVIDSTGQLVYSFGKTGSTLNAGEFTQPYGIAIINNDLYITDRTNNYIVRFRTGSW